MTKGRKSTLWWKKAVRVRFLAEQLQQNWNCEIRSPSASHSPHQWSILSRPGKSAGPKKHWRPTLSVSIAMNNSPYLIVSSTLKNLFSKIETIKDPSRNKDGILPSVSVETKLRVFSLWFLLAVAETTLPGLAWPVSTWYLSLPANVWKSSQLTFTLGVLEVAFPL